AIPLSLPLWPLAAITWMVSSRRRSRFLSSGSEPVLPTVVVGGITVGGTGKTPVLAAVVEHLQTCGLRPGIVSLGFGRDSIDSLRVLSETSVASEVGDEALMLFSRLQVPTVVAANRAEAVNYLAMNTDCNIVVSDDGLQHYTMPRSFEICVLDHDRGLGNGLLVPAGPLRESASRLNSVDQLLYRNGNNEKKSFCYRYEGFRSLSSGEVLSVNDAPSLWGDKRIMAATGLGQPEQFFDSVRGLGLSIDTHTVADHERLPIERLSSRADVVIITEKDAVKLVEPMAVNVWVLPVSAELPHTLLSKLAQCFAD
ncbi:MAG: tetraacyldisaccharide 4'-kinase, partial [Luminiphilus sp.]|nr:tetraacyldisaccharide 4'-kinase [Luminiphilus sp.]